MKRIITKLSVLFFLLILPFIFSCKKDPAETLPSDPVTISLTSNQVALIESGNSFAFDIFTKVAGYAAASENIIISPLSVSCALSMTLNGANGTTRAAMLDALRVNGLTPDIINNSYKDLSEALLSVDKRVLISIANSVWTEKNFVVKKPFNDILNGFYNAESKLFDIKDPLAPSRMNTWIESKTNGLIKNMIDKLNDNTVMLLINAIYFKGKWSSQFDKTKTETKLFHKSGGTSVDVPMMKQKSDFKIFDGEGFVMAEFPYGQGNFVMDVILPDQTNGLNGLIPSITSANFNTWLSQMRKTETDLSFPRFKYGYKNQLKDILTSMGMGIAFTDNADFSNISDIKLLISGVLHQAFIETNEEGTEAAAATIVTISTTSMPPPPIVMNIDHPFFYIIRETSTGSILFMGRVADPLAN
jgi:serine protease inhibitor